MAGLHDDESDSRKGPLLWGKHTRPTPPRPRLWTWPMILTGALLLGIIAAFAITVSLWLT